MRTQYMTCTNVRARARARTCTVHSYIMYIHFAEDSERYFVVGTWGCTNMTHHSYSGRCEAEVEQHGPPAFRSFCI